MNRSFYFYGIAKLKGIMVFHDAHTILQEMVKELVKAGTPKERLSHALLEKSFVRISVQKTPNWKPLFDKVTQKITTVPAKGVEATYIASIEAMSEEDAQQVIDDITEMAFNAQRDYSQNLGR